jgi:hypothetical protein
MRSHWTIAALLSSALIVGCSGRNNDNSQNNQQNQPGALADAPPAADQTVAPAPPVQSKQPSTPADNSVVRAKSSAGETRLPSRENSRAAQVAPPAPRAPQWREVTIPAGTALPLEMTSALSSESAQVETPVSARLRDAVVINGETAIPAGAVVTGTVTDVERSGRVQGRAHLSFAFNQLRLDDGREDLATNPVTFEAEATKGQDAAKVGAGAVAGAILGGILKGKKGAEKGAIAGGAVGTGVVLATRGKEVTVAEGTSVTATLAQPLALRIPIGS